MLIRRLPLAMIVALTPLGVLSAQNPAPAPSLLPPLQSSMTATANDPQPNYAPPEAHGYKFASAVSFGEAGTGERLTYMHNTDAVGVLVNPYDLTRPFQSVEDTMALLQGEVSRVRDSLYRAAQDQILVAYGVINDRPDGLHIGNQTIRYYWLFAQIQRRGQRGVYLYYAAYATPSGLVRVRGELPWLVAAHSDAIPIGAVRRTGAGVAVIEGAAASSNQANRNSSRSMATANATATNDASPFREQFAAFSTEFLQYMMAHPPGAGPPPAVVATGAVASPGAASANAVPAVCRAMPAALDTINYGVWASLEAPARKNPLPSGYVDLVLDALRQGLVVPNPLGLTAYAAMSAGGAPIMVPAVYGEIEFTLDNQGKMTDVHLTQSSLSPALDQAIYNAPHRADSLQAFPAQIGVSDPGPIRFYVAFSPAQVRRDQSMQLFAVRMPAWRPAAQPGIDPGRDVKPVFPVVAREAGVGDSVTIQFVVDDHGAPIQRTMRLISGAHIEYAQAVIAAAMGSQYIPGMAAGCPVNGLLERTWQMSVSQ